MGIEKKDANRGSLTMSTIVYKGYTSQQLDTQYNARAAVPGYEAIFDDWKARSANYRQRSACELDVPYGSKTSETLDLFMPDPANAPVHIFIHGGYWRLMDKSDFSYLSEGLVSGGALVAVVNYGLCPAVTMDEIAQQMRTACKWLWQNCSKYGGNPGSIHVSGHSAGGQQTAMLMATDWPSFSPDMPLDLIKSGVPVSGLFELEPMLHLPLNEDLKLDEESAHRNSPIFLNPRTDAPLSIVVGGEESDEFHRQSFNFNEKWRERGARTEYLELPGLNHFTIVDQMKNRDNPLTLIMLRHMGLE
jgi:arylformamidase